MNIVLKILFVFIIAANFGLATKGQVETQTTCSNSFISVCNVNLCEMKNLTKVCTECGIEKPINKFRERKTRKTGVYSSCRVCENKQRQKYVRTKDGLITQIYADQKAHSKAKGYLIPSYTKQELRNWILSQKIFHILFDKWVASGYEKDLRPSCDRHNEKGDYDYLSYTLGNLRIVTFKENREKGDLDRKNGINNKNSKAVLRCDLDGNPIKEYYSMAQAERETGISTGDISSVCSGKKHHLTAGGSIWKTI